MTPQTPGPPGPSGPFVHPQTRRPPGAPGPSRPSVHRQTPRKHGPLRADELAEAAILADLSAVLVVAGWLLPLGGILQAAAVTPIAVLGVRHRFRAVATGGACAMAVAFLLGGPGPAFQMVVTTLLGFAIGASTRWGFGLFRTILFAIPTVWLPLALLTVGALSVLVELRALILEQVRINWRGIRRFLSQLPVDPVVSFGDRSTQWTLDRWYIALPIIELVAGGAFLVVSRYFARPALDRLDASLMRPLPVEAAEPPAEARPVPVTLAGVTYRYPTAIANALGPIDLTIEPGTFVAVLGPNGSGKSTLARMLAGRSPTTGTIVRDGAAALGRDGGTAMVFQRPESQVLGVRVAEDVVWGLPTDRAHRDAVDVDALLGQVGLSGFENRETATLSGGELQRLAIAAALARNPRLLISDESTAMLDASGRRDVVTLLRRLVDGGLTVVHVTHRVSEAEAADTVIELGSHEAGGPRVPPVGERAAPGRRDRSAPLVVLKGVGHVYGLGSPWEHRGLERVDLEISPGERVVVTGHNGSGKSTLAWILAGLIHPTEGTAMIGGGSGLWEPIDGTRGRVLLAFQHARLQLFRPTVSADLQFAGTLSEVELAQALARVGLDPSFAERRIDELSGGEQRRVALASLLARRPEVLVLDEPLAALDVDARETLLAVLTSLREQHDLATVVVSHDLGGAELLADRAVLLDRGRVVSDGPIGDVRPRSVAAGLDVS